MKTKFFLFIFIVLLLTFSFLRQISTLSNSICFNTNSNEQLIYAYSEFDYENYILCGKLKIIEQSSQPIDIHILLSDDYLGESFEIKNLDICNFLKYNKIKIISTENVDNILILNCYSTFLPKHKQLYNKNINIQIAIQKESIIIGYPLILGSF